MQIMCSTWIWKKQDMMPKDEPINRFVTRISGGRFEPARGEATLCGVAVEIDDASGLARAISPVRIGGRLRAVEPDFWDD